MKKRKKKKLSFTKIYTLFFTLITIIFIVFLKIVNIVPTAYFIIILLITFALFLLVILMLKKKRKIGYILSILIIIIYSVITYYLGITMNFFSSLTSIHYTEKNYLVIVLNNEKYNNIKDLNNKSIADINKIDVTLDKALDKLNKKVQIKNIEYSDYNTLFTDLESERIESIFIEEAYYNIKKEEESTENYKIIDTIKIRSLTSNNLTKSVDITKDPFTIYISGIDTYGSIETVSRSDVNILMTINPITKQVLLTSIPRDYYVQLSGTTGYKDKLTHAGNYGIDMSINTIEELLDIDINYYIRVNFSTLEKIIDALDGVDVYSRYSFVSYIDNYMFYEGYNHMNGKQALAFSRERKSLPNGDIDRGKNQQAVIEAIIRKITSKDIIYKYTKILNSLRGTFQTNISDDDITKMVKKELENIGGWTITSISLEGTSEYNYTYSYNGQKLYVLVPDQDSINETVDLIKSVINGNKLEKSYDDNPSNIKNPNKVEIEIPKEEENNEDIEEEDTNDDISNNENENNSDPLEDLLPEDNNENAENDNTDTEEEIDSNIQDLLPNSDT